MVAGVIETRAVVTAQDRTGATFAEIAKKVVGLERTLEGVNRRASSIASGGLMARKAEALAQSVRSTASSVRAVGASAMTALGINGAMAGVIGAVASGAAAHRILHAGSQRLHEQIRQLNSGMSVLEVADANSEAARLSAKFTPVSQTEIQHMLRNARSIVGTYEEAAQIMEPMLRLRIIAQAARPGQDVTEDFDQLVKGLEIKGVTQNMKQFREYMEGIAKGLNVFGDTLRPYQYYEMFKYGRQATPGLGMQFMLSTAPTLAQELGGSSYGKAVSAFNAAIVGGVMKHTAAAEFAKLGLVKDEDLVKLKKTGEIKGIKPGRNVIGWQLAQSDPNEWVKQYFIPALVRAGITSPADQLREVGRLFQNQMAGQMVGLLTTQQSRINKDAALLRNAPGLAAAERLMKEDFDTAWHGFKSALENVEGSLGLSFAKGLTPAINSATAALERFNLRLQEGAAKEHLHPGANMARVRRLGNEQVFGVPSSYAYFDYSPEAITEWNYLKALGARLPPEQVEQMRTRAAELRKQAEEAKNKPSIRKTQSDMTAAWDAYDLQRQVNEQDRNEQIINLTEGVWALGKQRAAISRAQAFRARGGQGAYNIGQGMFPEGQYFPFPGTGYDWHATPGWDIRKKGPVQTWAGAGVDRPRGSFVMPEGLDTGGALGKGSSTEIGAAVAAALGANPVKLDPNSKADVTVRVVVEGQATATAQASSSGNISAHAEATAIGGKGITHWGHQ